MNIFENILTKLTLNEIGNHLSNFADLYIRPVKVWRTIINKNAKSYKLTILYIVYYFLLIFIIKESARFSFLYILFELVFTVVPFSIYFIPFKVYSVFYRKLTPWTRMFRLFVILKMQFLSIIFLLLFFENWFDNEDYYIIIDNLIFLLLLAFVIVFPIIQLLKFWQKILWIITNFFFLIMSSIVISWLTYISVEKSNYLNSTIINNFSDISPNYEYISFINFSSYPEYSIRDDYYLAIYTDSTQSKISINYNDKFLRSGHYFLIKRGGSTIYGLNLFQTQFVTSELLKQLIQANSNRLINQLSDADSFLINEIVYPKKDYIDSIKSYHKTEELTMKKLDSLRDDFNKVFYHDYKLSRNLKDSAYFKSNREYFSALHKYLKQYEQPYIDYELATSIFTEEIEDIFVFENNKIAVLYNIDSTYFKATKKEYLKIERKHQLRAIKSNIFLAIIYFISETIDYFDSLKEVE